MIRGLPLFCLLWSVTAAPLLARSHQSLQKTGHPYCGTYPGRLENDLRKYRELRRLRAARLKRMAYAPVSGATEDIDDIAIIEDDGTIVTPFNFFDLKGKAVRFTPVSAAGSYRVSIRTAELDQNLGNKLAMNDDDASEYVFTGNFHFSYFGKTYSSVFINSDGNATFIRGDAESIDRDLTRLNSGPPRIAPFLADLDPSVGQGGVFINQLPDRLMITWNGIREWGSFRANTFQLNLFPDGSIETIFGQVSGSKGITGISPGSDLQPVNIIDISTEQGAVISGAVAEQFSLQTELDLTEVSKTFFKTHPDTFDQLVMFTNFPWELGDNAFAFELNIKNEIQGIGVGILDASSEFGSSGGLQSFLAMNQLAAYPDNPDAVFLGTNSTVDILGQESGHRWLAYVRLGTDKTTDLLGRDSAHWSFFLNSEASVMEGNQIQDNGDGSFTTTSATDRYGKLDQYIMGLLDPASVGPMFYVSEVSGTSRTPSSPPAIGVTFRGIRKNFAIGDIIAAEGQRVPDVNLAPKIFRQAFILLVRQGTTPSQADLKKISQIRRRWQNFFSVATDGRGTADTTINTIPLIPTISNISPFSGSTLGNTPLYITGLDFQEGVSVKVGSTLATHVVRVSSTLITATTPAGAPGTASISVINPNAAPAVQPSSFTYLSLSPPLISSNALRIPIAVDNLTYRSNLGINNPNSAPANVRILHLDSNGLLLNQSQAFTIQANGFIQKNSVLRELEGASSATGREGSLVLESDQPIEGFLSVIKNITDDPSILDGIRTGASQLILQSSANTGPFRSNLSVVNLSPNPTNVTITSLNRETGQTQGIPLENISLPSNGFISFSNILESLSILNDFGPVEIRSNNGALLAAVSQVSGLNSGTSGYFPSLPENSASLNEIIPFVIDTDAFRTNLGLNNLGSQTALINVTLIGQDGRPIGSTSSPIQVPPLGLLQINNVIRYLVNGSSDSASTQMQGYLKITSNTPFKAFATQIDNLSNDPSIESSVAQGSPHLLLKSSSNQNFQSTLAIVNPNNQTVSVRLTARQGDGTANGSIVGTRTLTISAQGYFATNNLLQFIGFTSGFGPVEIQCLDNISVIAVSRVYSTTDHTSGFFNAQPIR